MAFLAFILMFVSVSCTIEMFIMISENEKSGSYMRLAAGATGFFWALTAAAAGWLG